MKSNNLLKWSFGIVVLILLGSLWFGVERNEYAESMRLENKRILRDATKAQNQFRKEAEDERKYRKAIEADFSLLQIRYKKDSIGSIYWKTQYLHEKNKKFSHYSDAGYDSLVSGLYPD